MPATAKLLVCLLLAARGLPAVPMQPAAPPSAAAVQVPPLPGEPASFEANVSSDGSYCKARAPACVTEK